MAAGLMIFPGAFPSRSLSGDRVTAQIGFYENGAPGTPKAVYADAGLTTPLANPVHSDALGNFPNIYADTAQFYTAVWSTEDGQSKTLDDLSASTSANQIILDQTLSLKAETQEFRDEAQASAVAADTAASTAVEAGDEAVAAALSATEAAQTVADVSVEILAAKVDALAARADALDAAAAFSSLVDFDSLDFSVLLRFFAAGRRDVGSIELDGAWNLTLKDLKLNDGFQAQVYETLDGDLAGLALFDPAGRVVGQVPDLPLTRRVAGLEGSATSFAFFETIDPDLGVAVFDPNGRVVANMPASAPEVAAIKAQVAAVASTATGVNYFETLDGSLGVALLDPNGRVLVKLATSDQGPDELVVARGSRYQLGDRLNAGLTPYGDVKAPTYGRWLLRETRMRLRARKLSEAMQFVVIANGDSWIQGGFWLPAAAKAMQDEYGFAGIGWMGFSWASATSGPFSVGTQPANVNGCARPDLAPNPTLLGNWSRLYNDSASSTPDLGVAQSSTAGDQIKFDFPAGHSAANLFYAGDGTGVVRYSWSGGASWSADLPLTTVGAAFQALAGVPATAGTFVIEVVSGNVSVSGVDMQSSANGVRVHKLGGSGSSTAHWSSVNATKWRAMIAALGAHLYSAGFGVNDQGVSMAPPVFAANIGTIVSNVRAALPAADVLFMMPPETNRTPNAYAMGAYGQAAREYAVADKVTFLDLQFHFGDAPADYAWANANRKWLGSDLIHPVTATGGRVIADAWLETVTQH